MPKNNNIAQLEKDVVESAPYLGSDESNVNMKNVDINSDMLQTNQHTRDSKLTQASQQQQQQQQQKASEVASKPDGVKPWVHFVAGGVGGMAGAVVTCPLDVVKTRLQSDVYKNMYKTAVKQGDSAGKNMILHFRETIGILGSLYKVEGFNSLFKGLGPNLVGVIPARSINFFTYGTTKEFYSKTFNNGKEDPYIHLMAAATAGWATSTATNPIWLIKTRLQLDQKGKRQYKNSLDCFKSILKNEGIFGMYRGLSASYLGSIEGILQWLLYEQIRRVVKERSTKNDKDKTGWETFKDWAARSGGAGCAKFFASIATYPHEVVRTRLRQAPKEHGKPKYTGLLQTFRVIIKEEGLASMYSGLTPHLLRTVPNSIIMFGTWEFMIKLLSNA